MIFLPPLPKTADEATDARAQMSVAAKMSLFKVSPCLSALCNSIALFLSLRLVFCDALA